MVAPVVTAALKSKAVSSLGSKGGGGGGGRPSYGALKSLATIPSKAPAGASTLASTSARTSRHEGAAPS